ncbi:carbohydrate kinase [Herbiconiux moechotypicola]|uniref:Carbohydrate kinase n=1 Tax=Herbiconiux moechotypicola TaxID=637393 RepID=A0ABP5QP70_9MICO|nr:carbohydrate kinase [Herbiconiux moechotypicola]MCS5731701.1 carbohydrate kinase [Herbiconiux moechotypicola]
MIVALGEALIDLIQRPDGLFEARVGGGPLNTAVTIARLGGAVEFAGRVSSDAFGTRILERLRSDGVGTTLIAGAAQPTTLSVATLSDTGGADYSFYLQGTADWQWTSAELGRVAELQPAALHVGSLSAAIEPGSALIETLQRELATTTLISYDMNLRPGLGLAVARERDRVERQVRLAHIVKASDDDIAWLHPGVDPFLTAASWTAPERAVVVTTGAAGAAVLLHGGHRIDVPGVPVEVADTIGAGDSFCGGLLVALDRAGFLADGSRGIRGMTSAAWTTALSFAMRVAALTCTRVGAEPPTLRELDDFAVAVAGVS